MAIILVLVGLILWLVIPMLRLSFNIKVDDQKVLVGSVVGMVLFLIGYAILTGRIF